MTAALCILSSVQHRWVFGSELVLIDAECGMSAGEAATVSDLMGRRLIDGGRAV